MTECLPGLPGHWGARCLPATPPEWPPWGQGIPCTPINASHDNNQLWGGGKLSTAHLTLDARDFLASGALLAVQRQMYRHLCAVIDE